MPHPWRRTWVAIAVSVLATPALVDSLIARQRGQTALISLVRPCVTVSLRDVTAVAEATAVTALISLVRPCATDPDAVTVSSVMYWR